MRLVAVAAVLFCIPLTASGQPRVQNMDRAVQTISTYDDLSCAARYTLAAVVIRGLDSRIAEYYASRAEAAGSRYLQTHPGESSLSYVSRVRNGAQNLQDKLAANTLSPKTLVAEIKLCDRDADSKAVL